MMGATPAEEVPVADASRAVLSVEEYAAELAELVVPDRGAERLDLTEAQGRVLAEAIASPGPVPVLDNTAMDGYAVRAADAASGSVRLRVVADVPAGSSLDPALGAGECVRIMTGAPVPSDADAIIPVEHTSGWADPGEWVEVRTPPLPGAHIRRAGEDVAPGAEIAAAGTLVTPGVAGALAAVGVRAVAVRPRPVVAVAATGDELVADGARLARGQIHESNGEVLRAALRRDGAWPVGGGPLPDEAAALTAWLDAVSARADLVVLTGGASVGTADVVRDVLTARGGGVFRHVRMQPGKPQGHGRWGAAPVIALPGNPVSATLSYEMFVRPLLDRRLGRPGPRTGVAVAGGAWRSPEGRRQLIPVALAPDAAARLVATPIHARGSASHLASALAGADGIAVVAEHVTRVAPGDLVGVRWFG